MWGRRGAVGIGGLALIALVVVFRGGGDSEENEAPAVERQIDPLAPRDRTKPIRGDRVAAAEAVAGTSPVRASGATAPPASELAGSRDLEPPRPESALRFRFVDAITGAAIGAPARYRVGPPDRSTFHRRLPCDDGVYAVPVSEHRACEEPGAALLLVVQGYTPVLLEDLVDRLTRREVEEIPLDPARTRTLRLVDAAGSPFRSGVRVREPTATRELAQPWTPCEYTSASDDGLTFRPDETGRVGPFEWFGADVIVEVLEFVPSMYANLTKEQVTVPSAQLEEFETVVVELDIAQCNIRVRGVPKEHPALLFMGPRGDIRSFELIGPGTLQVTNVAPGWACVGPEVWVRQCARRIGVVTPAIAHSLAPGETLEIDWDERWAASADIEGEVRGVDPSVWFLVPVYADASVWLGDFVPKGTIEIGSTGTYHIPAGAPVPELLLIARRSATIRDRFSMMAMSLVLADAVTPGESIDVGVRSLRLRVEGTAASDKAVQVGLVRPRDALAASPLRCFVGAIDVEWFRVRAGMTVELPQIADGFDEVWINDEAGLRRCQVTFDHPRRKASTNASGYGEGGEKSPDTGVLVVTLD